MLNKLESLVAGAKEDPNKALKFEEFVPMMLDLQKIENPLKKADFMEGFKVSTIAAKLLCTISILIYISKDIKVPSWARILSEVNSLTVS